MTVYEVVTKLIGPIEAVGETHTDTQREKSLDAMIVLVDLLVYDISQAAQSKNRREASMASIGKKAQEFLNDLVDSTENGFCVNCGHKHQCPNSQNGICSGIDN